jgi:hypothetical protein
VIDIGHGISIEVRGVPGVAAGLDYVHHSPTGARHESHVPFNQHGETQGWDVLSTEPLTLSPSLRCRRCGHHGFIRDGRWVPA